MGGGKVATGEKEREGVRREEGEKRKRKPRRSSMKRKGGAGEELKDAPGALYLESGVPTVGSEGGGCPGCLGVRVSGCPFCA